VVWIGQHAGARERSLHPDLDAARAEAAAAVVKQDAAHIGVGQTARAGQCLDQA